MLLRHIIRSVLVFTGLGSDGMWKIGASHVSYVQHVNPGNGRQNCRQNFPAIHSSEWQWTFWDHYLNRYFTKWMESFAIPNIEAVTVAEAFVFQFVSRFGVPDFLHTDQGRNFESALLKAVCSLFGVSKTRTSPDHPQSDGLIERFNRTLLSLLSMATRQGEHNWDLHLPLMMLVYRTSVQESTGCTPFELVFGREARLQVDVMYGLPPQTSPTEVNQYALDLRLHIEKAYQQVREHMGLQHQRQKELYNKSSNGDPFKVGDMVWLHCPAVPRGKSPKLHCFWQGPYRIHKVVSDVL